MLGFVGFVLLVGGLVAGGTILNVAIARVGTKPSPSKQNPDYAGYSHDPQQADKDTAWLSLWWMFLIGTVAGLILLGTSIHHFTATTGG